MTDSLCGPSNALQTFKNQTFADRTLQQDRLATRPEGEQGFRSSPDPNAGILDAEFEVFQANRPSQEGFLDPGSFHDGPLYPGFHTSPEYTSSTSFRQNVGQPVLPNWASDFQNLHLNETPASSVPQFQFRQHTPQQGHTPTAWHREYLGQQNHLGDQHRRGNFPGSYQGVTPYRVSILPQQDAMSSSAIQQKQPEMQADDAFDEAAFERAFEAARTEMQQSEEAAQKQSALLDQDVHLTENGPTAETINDADLYKLGADKIPGEEQGEERQNQEKNDADELARTAGQLLQNVRGDQSKKFQESTFLSLMRQLRDKEVRVEGDKLVDVPLSSLEPAVDNGRVRFPSFFAVFTTRVGHLL